MKQELIAVFNKQSDLLVKALLQLEKIHKKIETSEMDPNFSKEECFEILTSRFSRVSDLYTQKLLSFLFRLLQEPDLSFIDKCQRLEKLGLTNSVKELYDIRSIRNQITHEYALDDLEEIHQAVMQGTPHLIALVQKTILYIKGLLKNIR